MPILKSSVFLLLLFLNPLQGSTLGLRNGPAASSLPEKCTADKFFNLETGQCSSCAPQLIPSPEGEWGIDGGLGQGKEECMSNSKTAIFGGKNWPLEKFQPLPFCEEAAGTRSLNELLAAVFTASKMPALQKGSALVHPEGALGAVQ